MQENLAIFDFTLTDEEMTKIASLDKQESSFFDHRNPTAVNRLVNLVR